MFNPQQTWQSAAIQETYAGADPRPVLLTPRSGPRAGSTKAGTTHGDDERYWRYGAVLVALAPDLILGTINLIVAALQRATSTLLRQTHDADDTR